MDFKSASRIFFALTLIAIGIVGLSKGDFAPIWQPVGESVLGRQPLAYLCALVSLACGAGLLAKRTLVPAALIFALFLLVWTAVFRFPFILKAPLEEVSYQTNGENAVLIAAAWLLYAEAAGDRHFLAGDTGLRFANLLYGLALVAFGLSHFFYLQMTAPLVPSWLPGPVFWAYVTGAIYLATGVALVAAIAAWIAALAAAIQITLITILVWGPMLFAGPLSSVHWQETIVSWALTAGAWAIASVQRPGPTTRPGLLRRGPSIASDSRP